MTGLMRFGLGVLVRGGIVLGAYLLVNSMIWSRADLGGFAFAIGLAALGDWGRGGQTERFVPWLRVQILFSVGYAATLVAGFVLLGALFGDDTLASSKQRVVFGMATAVAAWFWYWMRRGLRSPAFSDPRGEDRRAAIRANVRREIEEIEKSARGSFGRDEHSAAEEMPRSRD